MNTGPGHNRHSGLSKNVYMDVLESELALKLTEAKLLSQCAIMSHPDTDYDKVVANVKKLYANMLGSVDYITGGKSVDEIAQSDRQAAVDEFMRIREAALKKHRVEKPAAESLQIKAL